MTFVLAKNKHIIHSIAGCMGFTISVSVPLPLNPMGWLLKHYKAETLSLENHNLLQQARSMTTFCSRGKRHLSLPRLFAHQPLLWGEALHSKAAYYLNVLEDSPKQKTFSAMIHKMYRSMTNSSISHP